MKSQPLDNVIPPDSFVAGRKISTIADLVEVLLRFPQETRVNASGPVHSAGVRVFEEFGVCRIEGIPPGIA
jgi:hypothetical protein